MVERNFEPSSYIYKIKVQLIWKRGENKIHKGGFFFVTWKGEHFYRFFVFISKELEVQYVWTKKNRKWFTRTEDVFVHMIKVCSCFFLKIVCIRFWKKSFSTNEKKNDTFIQVIPIRCILVLRSSWSTR